MKIRAAVQKPGLFDGATVDIKSESHTFDPDSYTIRDAVTTHVGSKPGTSQDAMNPVPRRTGLVPQKPTSARNNF